MIQSYQIIFIVNNNRSKTAIHTFQYQIHLQFTVQIGRFLLLPCEFFISFLFFRFLLFYQFNFLNNYFFFKFRSRDEKNKWMQDLYDAIEKARSSNEDRYNFSTLKSNSSSDNNLDTIGILDDNDNESSSLKTDFYSAVSPSKSMQHSMVSHHRSNTTMHVCWHRHTSVGASDNHRSVTNQLSGYLLRKFKNSNGWQKLWVVFTNFCLFFYKTYQDEFPLASLPLLGYTITIPSDLDNINKDFVFKLKFKNHIYFFRAESQYSFDRWLEVIESAALKECMLQDIDDDQNDE